MGFFFICLKCTAWRPFSRGPTFSKFRYFQVFFGNKTLVNKIVMQKGAGYSHHPSQLSLRYSNDGYSWQTAETVRNIGVAVRSSIIERNASFLQTRSLYMYISTLNASLRKCFTAFTPPTINYVATFPQYCMNKLIVIINFQATILRPFQYKFSC